MWQLWQPKKLTNHTATSDLRSYMSYVQSYIERLQAHAEVLQSQHHSKSEVTSNAPRIVKPLTSQIKELMKSMPPKLLNRPWSMSELVLKLDGKYRDRPHAKNVGDALRRTGWKSIRHWGKGYNGVRLWIPPAS